MVDNVLSSYTVFMFAGCRPNDKRRDGAIGESVEREGQYLVYGDW